MLMPPLIATAASAAPAWETLGLSGVCILAVIAMWRRDEVREKQREQRHQEQLEATQGNAREIARLLERSLQVQTEATVAQLKTAEALADFAAEFRKRPCQALTFKPQ